jgi:predicted AAA+ superfamily ATPase
LEVLDDSFLIAPISKYAFNEVRSRKAPAKLIALNNALLAALHPEGPPQRAHEPARFGTWVENACIASARNAEQQVFYWREGAQEVDAVIDGSWGRWALEVKTGAYDSTDLRGLLEFTRRHPAFKPLVLCDDDYRIVADRLGIASIDWRSYLVAGIPSDLA